MRSDNVFLVTFSYIDYLKFLRLNLSEIHLVAMYSIYIFESFLIIEGINYSLKEIEIMIIVFILATASANIICDGFLQTHNVPTTGSVFTMKIPSDPDCWYDKFNNYIQLLGHIRTSVTLLMGSKQIETFLLCQKVVLSPGDYYILSYSLYCPFNLHSMNFYLSWNNVQHNILFIESQYSFESGQFYIVPDQIQNQLCFYQKHSYLNQSQQRLLGGLFDNITLFKSVKPQLPNDYLIIIPEQPQSIEQPQLQTKKQIQPQKLQTKKIIINLKVNKDQVAKEINFFGDIQFESWMGIQLKDNIKVSFHKQVQQHSVNATNQGMIVISTQVDDSKITEIEVTSQNFVYQNAILQVEFTLDRRQVYFNLLNEDYIKIIEDISPASENLAEATHEVYTVISSSLSSYFVLSLINFWNLSLMYLFLSIDSMPGFSRNIYEVMIRLMYQQGSITSFFKQSLDLPDSYFQMEFQQELKEHMINQRYSEFHRFGFSSKFFLNNLQSSLIFGILAIKIVVMKLILHCIPLNIKKILELEPNYSIVVISQFIGAMPFLLISAAVMIKQSYEIGTQKVQKFFQALILFVCILILPMWLVYKFDEVKRVWKKFLREQRKQQALKIKCTAIQLKKIRILRNESVSEWKAILKAQNFQMKYTFYEYLFSLSIPLLVMLKNLPIFMGFHFVILVGRTKHMIENSHVISKTDRIFVIIMTIIWIIHHLSFFTLFLTDELNLFQELNAYLGILIIVTIVGGGVVELLRLLFEIILVMISAGQKLKKICKYYNKNKVVDQQYSQNEQKSSKKEGESKQNQKFVNLGNHFSQKSFEPSPKSSKIIHIILKLKKKARKNIKIKKEKKYQQKLKQLPKHLNCKFIKKSSSQFQGL